MGLLLRCVFYFFCIKVSLSANMCYVDEAHALILARGGSKGIRHKNLIEIEQGTSILAKTITTIKNTGYFEHIWVSTDSSKIAEEADKTFFIFLKTTNLTASQCSVLTCCSATDDTGVDSLRLILNLVSKNHSGFQLCYLNARSLNIPKIDYLNYLLNDLNVSIICVTETWFKEEMNDEIGSISSYNLIRNDRSTGARGGGIAVYYKKSMKHKVIFKSDSNDQVKVLIVEFGDGINRCLVVCVYNPHKSINLDSTFAKINSLASEYEHIMLCGDFNTDLLITDSKSSNLIDKINASGLHVANTYATRFSPNCKSSPLDLVCVSERNRLVHLEQLPLPGISDHDMLFVCYDIPLNVNSSETFLSYRDYNSVAIGQLANEAVNLEWDIVRYFSDINDKVS